MLGFEKCIVTCRLLTVTMERNIMNSLQGYLAGAGMGAVVPLALNRACSSAV